MEDPGVLDLDNASLGTTISYALLRKIEDVGGDFILLFLIHKHTSCSTSHYLTSGRILSMQQG